MTAKIDLRNEVYLYAQDLNNAGGTEYWRLTEGAAVCERLLPIDERLSSVRERLDALQGKGRLWPVIGHCLRCRVTLNGDCVFAVSPQTRDVNGRLSPVLVLFNVLGSSRQQAVAALSVIPTLMGRQLVPSHQEYEVRLNRFLSWPGVFIWLHIMFFSRVRDDD